MTSGDIIIGLGSPHGDDQIGWCLIEQLKQDNFQAATLIALSDPVDVLEHLVGVRRLIMVDACRSGGQAGTFTRLAWPDSRILRTNLSSTHRISLVDTLRLAQALGRLPEQVILFGVEVEQCHPQTDVCPAVRVALPELMRQISAEILAESQTVKQFG